MSYGLKQNHLVGQPVQALTENAQAVAINDLGERANAVESGDVWDTGDAQQLFVATDGQKVKVSHGTAASPDRSPNPVLKIERYSEFLTGDLPAGAAPEETSALLVIHTAGPDVTSSGQQAQGAMFVGETEGSFRAQGVQGFAVARSGASGDPLGGYFAARKDSGALAGSKSAAASLQSQNFSGTDDSYGVETFGGRSHGLNIQPAGNNRSAVAIAIFRNAGLPQFDVGLAIPAQESGAILSKSIVDDGNAATSIEINGSRAIGIDLAGGTFSGAAIVLANGSTNGEIDFGGPTMFGQTSTDIRTNTQLSCRNLVAFGTGGNGFAQFSEQSVDPAAGVADTVRLFAKDNGAGKTQLVARFNTGAVVVIATEP